MSEYEKDLKYFTTKGPTSGKAEANTSRKTVIAYNLYNLGSKKIRIAEWAEEQRKIRHKEQNVSLHLTLAYIKDKGG